MRPPTMVLALLGLLAAPGTQGCGGGGGGDDTDGTDTDGDTDATSVTAIATVEQAQRLLARAGLGGTMEELQALVGRDAADWIADELAKPLPPYAPRIMPLPRNENGTYARRVTSDYFWNDLVTSDATLRLRMIFALSQILVVGEPPAEGPRPDRYGPYIDLLSRNAFGTFRTLLEEVTYSPIMARYLTYLRNRKGDPLTGREPDENYAREVLQLFSIGLVELEPDGTPKLVSGSTVDTYDNDDIVGLANVFTGLSFPGARFTSPNPDGFFYPLQMFDEEHSMLEKRFLGTTIAAGTGGVASVDAALDRIAGHPNVAPFIGRQLIQRFTASHPSPAYVARVAAAFEAGRFVADNGRSFGTGQRGDLAATIAAVLLDPSLYDDEARAAPGAGKVREPVLLFVHWARAFRVSNVDAANERVLDDTSDPSRALGQHPFRSPSVFNFYRPGYVAPGTETGAAGLTAPELQLVNEGAVVGFANFMTDFIFNRTAGRAGDSFVPDYGAELSLAEQPEKLVDRIDLLLTGRRLTPAEKEAITAAVTSLPLDGDVAAARDKRVKLATLMVVLSPAHAVVY